MTAVTPETGDHDVAVCPVTGAASGPSGVDDPRGTTDATAPLPDGPRLPPLLQAIGELAAPFVFLPAMRRRFGHEFTMRFAPMHETIVSLSRPADIREVFRGAPEVFHAGKGNLILKPLLGRHSLLTQDGDDHARARRLLMPAFGRREIAGYRDLVRSATQDCLEEWPAAGPVRAHVLMNDLTLEVILRVIFGVTDTERLERMRPLVKNTVEIGPVMAIGAMVPRLHGVGPWKRFNRERAQLCELLLEEADGARTAPDLHERTDLLARLVRTETEDGEVLGDDELVDQLLTLVMAGHETTATAVSWTLLELARHPDIQERCVAEIRGDDDGREYLDAVLKESLRLHAVVSMVMRELQEPVTVAGRRFAKGTILSPAILLAHRDPANFPEPMEFRPERFLGDTPSPNTWLPFGGGARRCIGAAFAQMEGEEILRQVLTRYEIHPRSRWMEPARSRNVTSYPAFRARVRLMPRR